MAKFKQEILEKIKADSELFGKVANALEIKPVSLPEALKRNGNSLNQYSIVVLVADHLGMEPEDLVENESEGAIK